MILQSVTYNCFGISFCDGRLRLLPSWICKGGVESNVWELKVICRFSWPIFNATLYSSCSIFSHLVGSILWIHSLKVLEQRLICKCDASLLGWTRNGHLFWKMLSKKAKLVEKKKKYQCVAYAVLISLEYVENWSGNTRFWFINKNKLQRWKKAMYIYVKHPTNICYWSIILINAQTLATVVIYFVHAKYQTV